MDTFPCIPHALGSNTRPEAEVVLIEGSCTRKGIRGVIRRRAQSSALPNALRHFAELGSHTFASLICPHTLTGAHTWRMITNSNVDRLRVSEHRATALRPSLLLVSFIST